jgi:hypothetical protein
VIGQASEHDAIDVRQMWLDRVKRVHAAIEDDAQSGEVALQAVDVVVFQRRHLAVVFRREAFEHRIARMDKKGFAAGTGSLGRAAFSTAAMTGSSGAGFEPPRLPTNTATATTTATAAPALAAGTIPILRRRTTSGPTAATNGSLASAGGLRIWSAARINGSGSRLSSLP